VQTIKTAFVTAVLLVVGYGVWSMLNSRSEVETPDFAMDFDAPDLSLDGSVDVGIEADTSNPSSPVATLPAETIDTRDYPSLDVAENRPTPVAPSPTDPIIGQNTNQGFSSNPPVADVDLPSNTASPNDFEAVWQAAQEDLASGKLAGALRSLSLWYDTPQLTEEQETRLRPLLDKLAGTVIYGRQSILTAPHMTEHGDTIEQIAGMYQVPPQMLALINGFSSDDDTITVGDEAITIDDPLPANFPLKVVQGPFRATINLSRKELTVWVDGCFAGRFTVQVNNDAAIREGVFAINQKLDPHHGLNADGEYSLAIDKNVRIHNQTPNPSAPDSIVVSERDAQDLFALLAEGSSIEIVR